MLNSFSKLPVGVRRMYIHPVPQRTHFMYVCNSGLPVQPLDRNRAGLSDRCNPVPSAIPTYLILLTTGYTPLFSFLEVHAVYGYCSLLLERGGSVEGSPVSRGGCGVWSR
jgi:hypothetical protein